MPIIRVQNWQQRGLGAIACIALVVACGSSSAADIEWKTHDSKDGRFTAKFPAEPKVEKKPNATHTFASPPGVDADFRVAYTDRENTDANLEAAFKELTRIREATCKQQGLVVDPDALLEYLHGGLPACRFAFTKKIDNTQAYYQMIFIMDGKRFYQVLFGYATDKPMKKEGEIFVKSFKINR